MNLQRSSEVISKYYTMRRTLILIVLYDGLALLISVFPCDWNAVRNLYFILHISKLNLKWFEKKNSMVAIETIILCQRNRTKFLNLFLVYNCTP